MLLAGGVWIAISLGVVAWLGLQLFTTTPPEVNLFQAFWGSNASWTLAALPLFVWMGEILFRTRLSDEMFEGLAPWLGWLPGRLMHVNILGCGIFGGGVRLLGRDLRDHRQGGAARADHAAATTRRPALGSLCGAGTLGILIPPSIIMVVYAVAAEVSILRIFVAGLLPGLPADGAVLRLHHRLGAAQPGQDAAARRRPDASCEKLRARRATSSPACC